MVVRVLAIGRSEYLLNTLRVVSRMHQLVGVITGPATAESSAKEKDFQEFAELHSCAYMCSGTIDSEVLLFCDSLAADVVISVNWMSVIQSSFIDRFPHGVLNAHCGDIPDYRGNAILNWVILRGEKKLTVSVHKMTAGELDVGDVYAQSSFSIAESDDVGRLVSKLGEAIPQAYSQALRNLEQGVCLQSYSEVIQKKGFRCYPRLPVDGCIEWSCSAAEIDRLVRASSHPYPGAFTVIMHQGVLRKLVVWKARVVCKSTSDVGVPGHIILNDRGSGETYVYTGCGVLALQCVQWAGGDVFKPGEYFKSIRMRLGFSQGQLIELLVSHGGSGFP